MNNEETKNAWEEKLGMKLITHEEFENLTKKSIPIFKVFLSIFMFMLFHQKQYSGGFWENLKYMREVKKFEKEQKRIKIKENLKGLDKIT